MATTVYLLQGQRNKTYVGASCDLTKRLRQHNGEIAGGAAQTRGARPWTVQCTVTGFETRQHALQFEFAWRRVHRRMRPRPPYTLQGRRASLERLLSLPRWSRNAPPAAACRLCVTDA